MNWFGAKHVVVENEGAGSAGPVTLRPKGRPLKIGLAIGAGAARGWAHIGVLRELESAGIKPDVVAGTSIGAIVGGCYTAGKLDDIEDFALGMTRRRMFSLMDFSFSGSGLIAGMRLKERLDSALGDTRIENLPIRFSAVATEMGSGHELWLSKGSLVDAVRASYALPGIFEPLRINGRWLFDGALVNPIPITVCRVLGADFVIAININADLRRSAASEEAIAEKALGDYQEEAEQATQSTSGFLPLLRNPASLFRRQFARGDNGAPGIATAMVDAFNITQDRIARSRLAGDPPDFSIAPRLTGIGFFDFHRAADMIALGREATRKCLAEIRELVEFAKA
jgi:NTE family protein